MKIPKPRRLPSGQWFIQLRLNGESISITRPTEKEAVREATLVKAQHLNNIAPAITPSAALYDVIDDYIVSRTSVLSPSTIRSYRAYQRTRFQSYMRKPVNTIDWQRMINAEASGGASPKTVKNAWGLVRSALAAVDIRPTVRLPAPAPHEKAWLTPEEIPLFCAAIRGAPGEIGALLALSGLRRSEIYGLQWEDINLAADTIHIHQSLVLDENADVILRSQNKTASSTRTIPIMLPRLHNVLVAVENKTGPVVTGNLSTLRKRITRACAAAGIPDIGVHGLRHSFASLCYSLGISELATMQLGGWSDYQTMRKIYTHLSAHDKKRDAEKLTAFFANANKNANEQQKS